MSEYRYQINKSIDTLEEIVNSLKFMVTKDLEEDKKLLLEGWKSNNIGKTINICNSCQEEIRQLKKQNDSLKQKLTFLKYGFFDIIFENIFAKLDENGELISKFIAVVTGDINGDGKAN